MERSPIKDVEIKVLLRDALTAKIHDREVYMKGIDASYEYEGYHVFKTEALRGSATMQKPQSIETLAADAARRAADENAKASPSPERSADREK